MRLVASLTALVALSVPVFPAAVNVKRASSYLEITLSQVSNTLIKAVVQNTGSDELSFVHLNFFKDPAPVKKVSVYRDGSEVQFEGILSRYKSTGLSRDAFTYLAPGESVEDVFDIASTYDLTSGGPVTIRTEGVVPYATANSTDIAGYISYSSNVLTIDAITPLDRRTRISSCSGSRQSALTTALRNAASLANAAADAAQSGSASKFSEYFKTTSSSTRQTVAARLRAVAREASSSSSGATTYYCDDPYGYCSSNVLAYTLPSYNIIANCDIFYTYLPALTSTCHAQDQATTALHEFTHAPGVYSPGTDDLAYGYQAAMGLSSSQAVMNADTYALYANAIYLGC
ncbi:neutral protease II [Thermoascus aurantiacus ATCC 26904]